MPCVPFNLILNSKILRLDAVSPEINRKKKLEIFYGLLFFYWKCRKIKYNFVAMLCMRKITFSIFFLYANRIYKARIIFENISEKSLDFLGLHIFQFIFLSMTMIYVRCSCEYKQHINDTHYNMLYIIHNPRESLFFFEILNYKSF